MISKLHPFLLLLLFLGNLSYAQNYCGFDPLMEHFHVHPNEQIYEGEIFDLGLGMSLAPDGKIYQEESFSGYLSIIENPDVPAEEVDYQDNAVLLETVVNGFGHLHHSYIHGPSLFMEGDLTACQGVNIVLDAGEGYDSYEWQNGTEEQTFTVNQPGTYSVTATANGCTYKDQVQILGFIPPAIDLGPDLELCGDIAGLDAGNAFTDYVWQDGFIGPIYTAYEAGIYTVSASYPCEATGSITITDCGDIINNISEQTQTISIFPNPSSGRVDIQLEGESLIGRIELIDASGRIVLSDQLLQTKAQLDLSELSNGVYLLWLRELNKREKILLAR